MVLFQTLILWLHAWDELGFPTHFETRDVQKREQLLPIINQTHHAYLMVNDLYGIYRILLLT